ncbi:MAG: GNAT family protein [Bacteroidia bacterium]|nr:GNAT family protein [Bacteroidia bacterium]
MHPCRPAAEADFGFIFRLYMHPETNPWLLYEPMPPEAFRPVFDALLHQQVLYVFEQEGVAAGMFKLIPQPHRNSHVGYLGGVAIDPDLAGRGLGYRMIQAVLALGRSRGLQRIELTTAVINRRAIGLYRKAGFEAEGVLRRYTYLRQQGVYLDEVMMAWVEAE